MNPCCVIWWTSWINVIRADYVYALPTLSQCRYLSRHPPGRVPLSNLSSVQFSVYAYPVFDLHHARHSRLYAVLVTLWGTWQVEDAAWLSDCKSKQIWKQYCHRLKPILALIGGRAVTHTPRYLRGFTPGQQGFAACIANRQS